VIGAGAASGGVMDASNLIKPVLTNGELRCIGSTTYQEYRGIFEKDHALARRFQKIDVVEPPVQETIEILMGLKPRFEQHHGITYSNDAIRAAAELAARHINERHMPDKAIDVVDEAGARLRLKPANEREPSVEVKHIEDVVARMARIPAKSVSVSDKEVLRNLERNLKLVIYGQDKAIDSLAAAIKMARSDWVTSAKPVGSFLFAGPTGVGKTEVTRQLAIAMGIEFIRFDMSEYMERHTVSRLIGAPPGYVGFDQGGLLTEAIAKHPHCVLLLDEVEKAHPDVFNLLLQVMDHGTLTDNNGRKTDFRHVIIVMTTNAGAFEMNRASIGFVQSDNTTDGMEALKRLFSPEFRNRLDAIIQFAPLDMPVIERVVDKLILEVEAQLEKKGVSILLDDEARSWLAEKGYDPKMGARPMARLIQEQIKRRSPKRLLFGKLAAVGTVRDRRECGRQGAADSRRYRPKSPLARDAFNRAAAHDGKRRPFIRKKGAASRAVFQRRAASLEGRDRHADVAREASVFGLYRPSIGVVLEERSCVELQSAFRQPVAQQCIPRRADVGTRSFVRPCTRTCRPG
jgi:ATP-dependent Clp protease ATP-binding subunit ClpA